MSASVPSIPSPLVGAARTAAIKQLAARASRKARAPLFGRHGHKVVAVLCAYEVVAIATGWWPTLTELGRRHPVVKWSLSGALAHHFHLEVRGSVAPGLPSALLD